MLLPLWYPFTKRKMPVKGFTVDSSVLVKWFKKGEEFDEEATRLREEVLNGLITLTVSEWTLLEVARALMKVNFPREKVYGSYSLLKELADLGFLTVISVSIVRDLAKEFVVELNLFASDAVHAATAAKAGLDLVTEDEHLLRSGVKVALREHGIRILRLKDIFEGVGFRR